MDNVYRYDIPYDDFMKATSFDELLTKIYPSSEGSVLSMWYLKMINWRRL